jgi:hypothetical protein
LVRQIALIIQIALLLEQIVEMSAQAPTVATCFAYGKHYEAMHEHLLLYMSYYLRRLIKLAFGEACPLNHFMEGKKEETFIDETFWGTLAGLIPSNPLGKPRKLRVVGNQDIGGCSEWVELEAFYRSR